MSILNLSVMDLVNVDHIVVNLLFNTLVTLEKTLRFGFKAGDSTLTLCEQAASVMALVTAVYMLINPAIRYWSAIKKRMIFLDVPDQAILVAVRVAMTCLGVISLAFIHRIYCTPTVIVKFFCHSSSRKFVEPFCA